MRAARRALVDHRGEKVRVLGQVGCSRLMATVREKPAAPWSRPKCTLAMPPEAILP